MKNKKVIIYGMLAACSLGLAIGNKNISKASAEETFDYVKNPTYLRTNTKIESGAVTFNDEEIHIKNWAKTNTLGTAGVYTSGLMQSGEEITTTINSEMVTTGQSIAFTLNFFDKVPNQSFYNFDINYDAVDAAIGYFIAIKFKSGWIDVEVRDCRKYYGYSTVTLCSGNSGKNGTLSGDYNILDGNDHTVSISKTDTSTGINLSVKVDGTYYLENLAIGDLTLLHATEERPMPYTAIQGGYYFGVNGQSWYTNTTDDDYLDIKSLVAPKRGTSSDPISGDDDDDPVSSDIPSFDSVEAVDLIDSNFVVTNDSMENSVAYTSEGVEMKKYSYNKPTGVGLKKCIAAESNIEVKFKAYGELTDAQKALVPDSTRTDIIFNLMCSNKLYTQSIDYFRQANAKADSNTQIEIKIQSTGYINVVEYQMGDYDVNMSRPSSERTIAMGNNRSGTFDASTKLLDGNEHAIVFSTKMIDDVKHLSIAIDNEWYVDDFTLTNPTLYTDYFFSCGIEFNWPASDLIVSDDSQYLKITSLKVSDFGSIGEIPNYDEIYDEQYNLSTNEYNFSYDQNIMKMTESGLQMTSIIPGVGDGFFVKNGKYNEFDWAFKINLDLKTDSEYYQEKPKGDEYQIMNFLFMVDSSKEPQDGKRNSVSGIYYDFKIGKSFYAIPQSWDDQSCYISIDKHRGYSDSTSYTSYGGGNYKYGYQLCDGNDHWIVLKVRNYKTSTEQGVSIELWVDGSKEFAIKDADKKITDSVLGEVDWNVYGRSGYLGMNTGGNCATGHAQSSTCLFKEMYIVEYDSCEEGAYVQQAPEPDFDLYRNYDYEPQEVYYTNEIIRINLINLFIYEGKGTLEYQVVDSTTGEEIGSVDEYGQWSYQPTKAGIIEIKVTASVDYKGKHKQQIQFLTLNIQNFDDGGDEENNSSHEEPTSESSEGSSSSALNGCGGSITISFSLISLASLGALMFAALRKKEDK